MFRPRLRVMMAGGLVLGVLLGFGVLVGRADAALPSGCSSSATTVTCTFTTAGEHPFTVPAGVSSLHVVAVGGKGGNASDTAGHGGFGAVVSGDLTGLIAGEVLYAEVAGNGADGALFAPTGVTLVGNGGGGGGASDVRTLSCGGSCPGSAASLDSRLIVAAGGGGEGGTCSKPQPGGNGGDAGQPGSPGSGIPACLAGRGTGGQAGTATAGGAGGISATGASGEVGSPGQLGSGGAGSAGSSGSGQAAGGTGGGGAGGSGSSSGGGGGAGLYGGGGGGGTTESGGGGGGSSLVPAGGSMSTDTTGVPSVTLSYPTTAPPAITSDSSTAFETGNADSFTVTASGLPVPSLSESGALPPGVSFTDNGDGTATLSGTPAAGSAGKYSLTINASNGVPPDASQTFTLTVDQAPAVTSTNQATFRVGQEGSFKVTASGLPAPSLSLIGTLPAGVTFVDLGDGSATLAGTPDAGTAGIYPVTIAASNGVLPDASQALAVTVDQAPTVTSAQQVTFRAGQAASFTFAAGGVPAPSLLLTGTLPDGVTFVDNGDGTATLAGMPGAGAGGTYPLTIVAANGILPDATQTFTLTVEAPPGGSSGSAVPPSSATSAPPSPATIAAPGAGAASSASTIGPAVTPTPRLSAFRLTRRAFQAAAKGPSIGGKPDTGTTIRYHDTVAARTIFQVLRCAGSHRRCTKLVPVGSFAHRDHAGDNRLHFSGRVGRALRPGTYLIRATATLAGRKSRTVSVRFVIR